MGAYLCRAAEWLKLQRLAWLALLLFAVFGFAISVSAYAVRLLEGAGLERAASLANVLSGQLEFGKDAQDLLLKISLFFIGLSAPYLFVVCRQRIAVLEALASGYWRNYLMGFLRTDLTMFILPPSYMICKNPQTFVGLTKTQIETENGIELRETWVPEAGRSAFIAHVDGKELPIAVDMCRNLNVLGDILSKEMNRPFGGLVCKVDTKFDYLAEKFFAMLQLEWAEYNKLSQTYYVLNGPRDGEFKKLIADALDPRDR